MILVTSQLVELEHTLAFHKPILKAIEERDGEKAARLMTEHLKDATALLSREHAHQQETMLRDRITKTRMPVLVKAVKQASKAVR